MNSSVISMYKSRTFFTFVIIAVCAFFLGSCGVYSFTGASIDPNAKTVNVKFIENKASYVNPRLSQKLTQQLRDKVTSQTSLTQVNNDSADYVFSGTITGYSVTNAAVTNVEQAATNRLNVTISIDFKSRLDPKADFTQSFTRYQDYAATKTLEEVQDQLIVQIDKDLTDDIFNKAFVNW